MTRGSPRLVPVIFLLLAVWVVVFWAWKPHTSAITRDSGGPGGPGAGAFDKPADLAAQTSPPSAAAITPPPTPIPPAHLNPLRLGDRLDGSGPGTPAGPTAPRLIQIGRAHV